MATYGQEMLGQPVLATNELGAGGNVTLMLGALMINGLTPGPRLFSDHGVTMYAIMLGLIFVNLFMFLQGRYLTGLFAKIIKIPPVILTPIIVIFCFAGGLLRQDFLLRCGNHPDLCGGGLLPGEDGILRGTDSPGLGTGTHDGGKFPPCPHHLRRKLEHLCLLPRLHRIPCVDSHYPIHYNSWKNH